MAGKPPDNIRSNAMAMTAVGDDAEMLTEESTFEERMAVALSLVSFGASINKAAEETGVAAKTLWDRVNADTKSKNKERQNYIEHRALELTLKGLDRLEALLDDPNAMRPAEAIKATDTVAKIAAQLGKWSTPEAPPPPPEKKSAMREFIDAMREEARLMKKEEEGG